MTITRTGAQTFAVVTDTVLADGSLRRDDLMGLKGDRLRSIERKGDIRIGGLMTVKLGPSALAIVTGLAVGETASF